MSNAVVGSAGVLMAGVGVHLWAPYGLALLAIGVFMIFVSWPGDDK